jgi:D-3-phosphoglycerate dehydrogenase
VLPAEIIRGAQCLKIIAKHGAGYENIDLAAATACGVVVTSTPVANSQSVAEHALALLLAVARRIGDYAQDLQRGRLQPRQSYQGVELYGKTLGVVGVGESGRRLARMAAGGLRMRVLGYDPYRDPWPEGIERVGELQMLLSAADCLSIHVPLTKETRNLIGREALAQVKPTCVLVNTSRGGIVDETALAEAIRDGRLAGAGLDVVANEPIRPDHPLAGLQRVLLTPHVAGVTEEGMVNMARDSAEEVLRVLRGERPKYPLNPEVLSRPGATQATGA